jgi:hypothetical protein
MQLCGRNPETSALCVRHAPLWVADRRNVRQEYVMLAPPHTVRTLLWSLFRVSSDPHADTPCRSASSQQAEVGSWNVCCWG